MGAAAPSLDREDQLDAVFGALSHRTRRALLSRLSEGPASIGALAEPFSMTFAAVSKHLRVLERAGLVRREIDGRVHRCSLDAAPLDDAEQWIERQRDFWAGSLDSLARHLESDPR